MFRPLFLLLFLSLAFMLAMSMLNDLLDEVHFSQMTYEGYLAADSSADAAVKFGGAGHYNTSTALQCSPQRFSALRVLNGEPRLICGAVG